MTVGPEGPEFVRGGGSRTVGSGRNFKCETVTTSEGTQETYSRRGVRERGRVRSSSTMLDSLLYVRLKMGGRKRTGTRADRSP